MRKFFKYPLKMGQNNIALSKGATITLFDFQNGVAYIWALVDPNSQEPEVRDLFVVETGEPIVCPPHRIKVIGTAISRSQNGFIDDRVYHLIEDAPV